MWRPKVANPAGAEAGRFKSADQIGILGGSQFGETAHLPICVGREAHVGPVNVLMAATVGVDLGVIRAQVSPRRRRWDVPPAGHANNAEDHVRPRGQLPRQPVRVDAAVRVGGGIPATRAVGMVGEKPAGKGETRGAGGADVAGLNLHEVHVRFESISELVAAVLAGIQNDDHAHRNAGPRTRRFDRAYASRQS